MKRISRKGRLYTRARVYGNPVETRSVREYGPCGESEKGGDGRKCEFVRGLFAKDGGFA